MFIFGGLDKRRQIGKLNKCQLNNIGQLSFDLRNGACVNHKDLALFLCFHETSSSQGIFTKMSI